MSPRGRLAAVLLVPLVGASCTVTDADDSRAISVEVRVASASAPAAVTTDRGFEVTIQRAFVAFETIEILPCDPSAPAEAGLLQTLGIVGVAHAHTQVEPTRTGIPAVVPLASPERTEIDVGLLEPPPGRYCAARIKLGAADSDAVGMPDDGAAIGRTLVVEGSFELEGGAPTPFRLDSTATVTVDVPIEMTLGDDGRQTASVRAVVDGARLLDGLDLATVDGEEGGDAALAALVRTAVVELE